MIYKETALSIILKDRAVSLLLLYNQTYTYLCKTITYLKTRNTPNTFPKMLHS